jgi:hypothetical protein
VSSRGHGSSFGHTYTVPPTLPTAAVQSGCLLADARSSVVGLGLSHVQPLSLTIPLRRITTRLVERALSMPPRVRGTRLRGRHQLLRRGQPKRIVPHNRIVHRLNSHASARRTSADQTISQIHLRLVHCAQCAGRSTSDTEVRQPSAITTGALSGAASPLPRAPFPLG